MFRKLYPFMHDKTYILIADEICSEFQLSNTLISFLNNKAIGICKVTSWGESSAQQTTQDYRNDKKTIRLCNYIVFLIVARANDKIIRIRCRIIP